MFIRQSIIGVAFVGLIGCGLVVDWWEDEPWKILPKETHFIGKPDFVVKAYEVLK